MCSFSIVYISKCMPPFDSVVDSVWFETSNSLVHVGLKDTISMDTVLSRDLLSIVTWCPSNQKVHLKCQKAGIKEPFITIQNVNSFV